MRQHSNRKKLSYKTAFIIIIIIEFLTSLIYLGNIHLSWDLIINRSGSVVLYMEKSIVTVSYTQSSEPCSVELNKKMYSKKHIPLHKVHIFMAL